MFLSTLLIQWYKKEMYGCTSEYQNVWKVKVSRLEQSCFHFSSIAELVRLNVREEIRIRAWKKKYQQGENFFHNLREILSFFPVHEDRIEYITETRINSFSFTFRKKQFRWMN